MELNIIFYTTNILKNNKVVFNSKPKFIKVLLKEISDDVNLENRIGIFQFNPSKNHYEVERREYFKLKHIRNNSFTIELVNEENETLHLNSYIPTIIKLKVKEMVKESFILHINSNDSNSIYSNNTNTNFRISLPKQIILGYNEWVVALSSIFFPTTFQTNQFFYQDVFWIETLLEGEEIFQRIVFNNQDFTSEADLLNSINNECEAIFGENGFIISNFDEETKVISKLKMKFKAGRQFALFFGMIENEEYDLDGDILVFPQKLTLADILPRNLLIHTNFVEWSPVFSNYSQILKMIPIEKKFDSDQYFSYESATLDFVPVSLHTLNELHFSITDVKNNILDYGNKNKSTIVINLIFKRK